MELTKLTRLNPREYLHPFDQKALNTLQNTKGLDIMVKKLYEWGFEAWLKQQFLGSSLKMSETNFPEVHEVFETACQVLDFKQRPQLYVMRELFYDCRTLGVDNTIIVMGSDLVEQLSEKELLFIFGRQIGHIQSQHVLYLEIANMLPVLMDALSAATLGLGGLLSAGVQLALVEWVQTAEYTADRAGILACQDVTAACTALIKIAGLPKGMDASLVLDDFKTQAIEFQTVNKNTFMKFSKYLTQSKGWEIARANQFFQWTESGGYQNVIDRKSFTNTPKEGQLNFCPGCGVRLVNNPAFCTSCGRKLTD